MTKYVMCQHQLDVLGQRALMACCQAHECGFQRFGHANLGEVADALFHLCGSNGFSVLLNAPEQLANAFWSRCGPVFRQYQIAIRAHALRICGIPAPHIPHEAVIAAVVKINAWHADFFGHDFDFRFGPWAVLENTCFAVWAAPCTHRFLVGHGLRSLRVLVAQDSPVHIRAQVFAANRTVCQFLYGDAPLGWDSAEPPLIRNSVPVKPKFTRECNDPPAHLYCPVKGSCTRSSFFHAPIVDSLAIKANIFYL